MNFQDDTIVFELDENDETDFLFPTEDDNPRTSNGLKEISKDPLLLSTIDTDDLEPLNSTKKESKNGWMKIQYKRKAIENLSDDDSDDNLEAFSLPKKTKIRKNKTHMDSRRRYKRKLIETKEACKPFIGALRDLVPGVTSKTEKAGAIEMTVNYIRVLQRSIGGDKKQDFLRQIGQGQNFRYSDM